MYHILIFPYIIFNLTKSIHVKFSAVCINLWMRFTYPQAQMLMCLLEHILPFGVCPSSAHTGVSPPGPLWGIAEGGTLLWFPLWLGTSFSNPFQCQTKVKVKLLKCCQILVFRFFVQMQLTTWFIIFMQDLMIIVQNNGSSVKSPKMEIRQSHRRPTIALRIHNKFQSYTL